MNRVRLHARYWGASCSFSFKGGSLNQFKDLYTAALAGFHLDIETFGVILYIHQKC